LPSRRGHPDPLHDRLFGDRLDRAREDHHREPLSDRVSLTLSRPIPGAGSSRIGSMGGEETCLVMLAVASSSVDPAPSADLAARLPWSRAARFSRKAALPST